MKEISRDVKRLTDLVKSIDTIEQYIIDIDVEAFSANEMMQSACIRHLEIIGEACSKISGELKSKYTAVPWRQIAALRNLVVHEYFQVDVAEIWITIKRDLVDLREQATLILKELERG